jgi:hypothetical protein
MFPLARVLGTRLLPVVRTAQKVNVPQRASSDLTGWNYRMPRQNVPKRDIFLSEAIMGVMWYWVLFHLWYDYGHLVGHFDYPDPSKWTDAELGIPPDSED